MAFMRPIRPARYRGLGLRVGRCSAEFHTLGGGGSTPRPATVSVHSSMARYANWHRGQVEILVPVGSTPTRATDRDSSRRLAAKTPVLHTGQRRFKSCRDDSQPAGLQVFRQHTSSVRRETEFDSRADLRVNIQATFRSFSISGPWSKGKTSPWRGGDPGSTPGGSTRMEGSRIRFAEPSC